MAGKSKFHKNDCNQFFNCFSSLIRHVKTHFSRIDDFGGNVVSNNNMVSIPLNDKIELLPTHSDLSSICEEFPAMSNEIYVQLFETLRKSEYVFG